MEIYITIRKIDSQWEFAVWLRKLKQGLCINLEGLIDGEGWCTWVPHPESPSHLPPHPLPHYLWVQPYDKLWSMEWTEYPF